MMTKALVAGCLVIALGASFPSFAQRKAPTLDASLGAAVAALLQKDAAGYASADRPWEHTFPRDHGVHPDHRTESWHFSGTLKSPQGRRFGFQAGFFRIGVRPPGAQIGPSAWATRNLYWAQFALGDAAKDRVYVSERVERGALGLSGAEPSPPRVWVGDWSMAVDGGDAGAPMFRLQAAAKDARIALSLRSAKPPVVPAAGGARRAGSDTPNAFHAYVMTRLVATGTVHVEGQMFEVEGLAWLDRAWGLVPLPWGAVVWDRFLLQLDEGREIMLLRLRRRDGSGEPSVTGVLVARDGSTRSLGEGAAGIDLLEREGARFPARWRVRVPGEGIELRLSAYVSARETQLSLRSWSGAVDISGTIKERAIQGKGYVELAGYDGTARGK